LVRYDVDRGRDELNFSEWDRDGDEADDAIEMIREGEMPLSRYTLIHRDARLTDAEADRLVAALEAMNDGGEDEDRGDSSGPGSGDDSGSDDSGSDDSGSGDDGGGGGEDDGYGG
ncbi:MAG TPA: heme-binding domain-containing protein, partial [Acidimicrobiales bacterium]|nr:heme-binding domain-containing protein [Acidimicrobiales bacterium]